jgi:hypothetical protein
MVMPLGHGRSLRTQRRLARREKRSLGLVAALVAIFALAVVVAVITAGHSSGHGCIDVQIPSATGGSETFKCGAQARAMCRLVGARDGFRGTAGGAIATECRKAGLPVG